MVVQREVDQFGLDGSILLAVRLVLIQIWPWIVDHVLVIEHVGQCAHSYADNGFQVQLEVLNPLDDAALLRQLGHIWVVLLLDFFHCLPSDIKVRTCLPMHVDGGELPPDLGVVPRGIRCNDDTLLRLGGESVWKLGEVDVVHNLAYWLLQSSEDIFKLVREVLEEILWHGDALILQTLPRVFWHLHLGSCFP